MPADSRAWTPPAESHRSLAEARAWIADCSWAEGPDFDVSELTDLEVIKEIDQHYAGGWEEFLRSLD